MSPSNDPSIRDCEVLLALSAQSFRGGLLYLVPVRVHSTADKDEAKSMSMITLGRQAVVSYVWVRVVPFENSQQRDTVL